MKSKKLLITIFGLLAIVAMLVACAPAVEEAAPAEEAPAEEEAVVEEEAPAAEEEEPLYIPVISKGFQHAFWLAVEKGAEQAAADYGVTITFEGPETEAMVDKQMDMLQAAIDKNPVGICFAAVDSKAAVPLLEQADEKGIIIVGFDSGVDSDVPLATAATDNIAAAALAADKMVELIGGAGEVAVIAHDNTSRTGIDRVDGFVGQVEAEYPDVTVVDVQYGAGDHLKSTDLAKAIIQANPDLKGFFGANEGSIIGVLNAAQELGRDDLVIIGYDSGQQQIAAIKSGQEAGAITQNPIGIGYKCVEAVVKAHNGETLDEFIDTGFMWFDADNIDDPDIVAVLYE